MKYINLSDIEKYKKFRNKQELSDEDLVIWSIGLQKVQLPASPMKFMN